MELEIRALTLPSSVRDTIDGFHQAMGCLSEALAPYLQGLQSLARYSNFMDAMDAVGWLPYHSVSVKFVEECRGDQDLLDSRLTDYYLKNWDCIENELQSRLKDYAVDEESQSTFQEALAAHREGFYRCVCRVLFPEMERVLRMHFFEGRAGKISSCELLKRFANQGELDGFVSRHGHGYILFGRLVEHLYEGVNEDNRQDYISDSVPNRHAALHGLIPYSTYKHSVNMIVMTDYVFQTVTETAQEVTSS